MVPLLAKSETCASDSGPSVGVGGASDLANDGERRCRLMYDAEECERGSCGRPVTGDRGPSSLYDDDRLMAGLADFEEAGDCCEGGVYGIPCSCVCVAADRLVGRIGVTRESH